MAKYSVRWDEGTSVWFGKRGGERVWDRKAISGASNQDIYVEGTSKAQVKEAVLTEARWERNRTNRRQTVQIYNEVGKKMGEPKVIPPFTQCQVPK